MFVRTQSTECQWTRTKKIELKNDDKKRNEQFQYRYTQFLFVHIFLYIKNWKWIVIIAFNCLSIFHTHSLSVYLSRCRSLAHSVYASQNWKKNEISFRRLALDRRKNARKFTRQTETRVNESEGEKNERWNSYNFNCKLLFFPFYMHTYH